MSVLAKLAYAIKPWHESVEKDRVCTQSVSMHGKARFLESF